ncbi:MAG: hypothetical protein GX138_06775 [Firmicutes bacterium]|nr:hypothetical protein [Bacillota bacterium]
MFNVDDLVLYGFTGVCRVAEIKAISFDDPNEKELYYVLEPLYQECTISTPVDNTRIPMRAILTKKEAEDLIDRIPELDTEMFHSSVLRELTEFYDQYLNTYEADKLIQLCLSIYNKRDIQREINKKLGATDERYLKQAESLLFGEFAVIFEKDPEEIADFIGERLNSDWQKINISE